jgi:hypothetical protein
MTNPEDMRNLDVTPAEWNLINTLRTSKDFSIYIHAHDDQFDVRLESHELGRHTHGRGSSFDQASNEQTVQF